MFKPLQNTIKIVIIILAISLLLYILTGFVQVFKEHLGPLSTWVGSIASLTTCAIAIRAILIAKQWHSDKLKSEIFNNARDTLNYTTSIGPQASMILQDIKTRVRLLTITTINSSEAEKNKSLLTELATYRDQTYSIRQKTLMKTIKCIRLIDFIDAKYRDYTEQTLSTWSKFTAALILPIELVNNEFIISKDVSDLYSQLTKKSNSDLINQIAKIQVPEFMNFDSAIKKPLKT